MLEGQVAALSSGYLSSPEALQVLESMRSSDLFRPDQYSYILYPNKKLPGFLERNIIPRQQAESSAFIQQMVEEGNEKIVEQDSLGAYHFNGNFKNVGDLDSALDDLVQEGYAKQVEAHRDLLRDLFEQVFNHKAFTGRSGTFYAYEGLGSIYWHMVSKLLLAVQESCLEAIRNGEDKKIIGKILDHYYEIQAGIGVHKSPQLYGAFPTDPYSHTPLHRGAQQPGMTGQVKEDVIVRMKELGIFIAEGRLRFHPCLLRREEFLTSEQSFVFLNSKGEKESCSISSDQLFFSYCQVPITYIQSEETRIIIDFFDGNSEEVWGETLPQKWSKSIFERAGHIQKLSVFIDETILK
jgi:hypothetical protein